MTMDGKEKVKPTSSVISTAEAISLLTGSMALAASFGSGTIQEEDIAAGLQGAIVKDEEKDRLVWKESGQCDEEARIVMAEPVQRLFGDERMNDRQPFMFSGSGTYLLLALIIYALF